MTLSQQLFKSCRLQRHQNANILQRVSYETPTLLPCLFISTFSPTLFISRTVFESCFSPSLMICSTQRVRFFLKALYWHFWLKSLPLIRFGVLEMWIKFSFFYYFSPLFSIRTVFCISPLTLNWRTRSRCVHFISFAYRAFAAFYPNSDSKMWMEWNTWEFCFKKLATFRNSKPCRIYIPEIETHFKICFIIMVTIVYKTLKIRIWIHYIIFVFSEHDVKMHIIS